jgi:hypothetical protein
VHPECCPVKISDDTTVKISNYTTVKISDDTTVKISDDTIFFMCSSIQFVSVDTCTDMSAFIQVRQRMGHHRKRLRKVMASYLSI